MPYNRCSSCVLPLDTFEELRAAGIVHESDNVGPASLKREALDSVDAVHRDSGFQPIQERMESVSSASSVRPKQEKLEIFFFRFRGAREHRLFGYLLFTFIARINAFFLFLFQGFPLPVGRVRRVIFLSRTSPLQGNTCVADITVMGAVSFVDLLHL